jgi:peptide deformylase
MTDEIDAIPQGNLHEIVKSRAALLKPCEEFDFTNPQVDPIQLAADLVKTMYAYNGIGLAANQIGVPYRVFAMRTAPKNTVVFNPKIIHYEPETELLEEGCLSFPGYVVKIKRYKLIRVRFSYPNGEVKTETYKGLTSRVFQHEMEHLNGQIFYDNASKYHRDQADRRFKKYERNKKAA